MVAKAGEDRVETGEPAAALQKPSGCIETKPERADLRPIIGKRAGQHFSGVGGQQGIRMQKQQQMAVRRFRAGGELPPASPGRRYHQRACGPGQAPGVVCTATIGDDELRLRQGGPGPVQRGAQADRFVQGGNDDRDIHGVTTSDGTGELASERSANQASADFPVLSVSTSTATAVMQVGGSPKKSR